MLCGACASVSLGRARVRPSQPQVAIWPPGAWGWGRGFFLGLWLLSLQLSKGRGGRKNWGLPPLPPLYMGLASHLQPPPSPGNPSLERRRGAGVTLQKPPQLQL